MAADLMVKNAWYVAGLAHEFPAQQLQGQVIAEKRPVMWRTTAGSAVAFDERCRHKRMPLSQGRLVEAACSNAPITACATTGRGQCVRVPSYPDGHIPTEARLRPFPVIEQDVLVWIWPGDPAKAAAVRPTPIREIVDPARETADTGPMPVPANTLQLIENLLDITHF